MLELLEKIFDHKYKVVLEESRKLYKENHHNMCNLWLLRCEIIATEMFDPRDANIRFEVPIQNSGQKAWERQVT